MGKRKEQGEREGKGTQQKGTRAGKRMGERARKGAGQTARKGSRKTQRTGTRTGKGKIGIEKGIEPRTGTGIGIKNRRGRMVGKTKKEKGARRERRKRNAAERN